MAAERLESADGSRASKMSQSSRFWPRQLFFLHKCSLGFCKLLVSRVQKKWIIDHFCSVLLAVSEVLSLPFSLTPLDEAFLV